MVHCTILHYVVYKSIVFGEAVRFRRLNENKSNYLKSLANLKDKCFRSNFNQKLQKISWKLLNIGKIVSSGNHSITRRTELLGQRSLPNNFKFLTKKKLKPKPAIVYKNPPTLATKLTNYKKLTQILSNKHDPGSHSCGKCALCENFKNYENMVNTVDSTVLFRTQIAKV